MGRPVSELRECPFCGGGASSGQRHFMHGDLRYVQTGCEDCGALGPRVEISPSLAGQPRGVRLATPAADAAWNVRNGGGDLRQELARVEAGVNDILNWLKGPRGE